MTLMTYYQFVKKMFKNFPIIVYTIGSMGSGKTTLAILTYRGLKFYRPKKTRPERFKKILLYYYNAHECETECIDQFINTIQDRSPSTLHFVVLDDYSFVLQSRTKKYYEFLNKLFRIRHLTGTSYIILWFNGHYSRSLAPFIRSTNYRILTSISPAEIKQYASEYIFAESDLWEYYNYYTRYPSKKIILAEFRSISKIIDITFDKRIKAKLEKIASDHGIKI